MAAADRDRDRDRDREREYVVTWKGRVRARSFREAEATMRRGVFVEVGMVATGPHGSRERRT